MLRLPRRAALFALSCCACLYAQEPPFLIPHAVFVGDRARLVFPLGPEYARESPFVVVRGLPASAELVIHRVELETRGGNPRILIDFTAFAAGSLSLPHLPLPAPLPAGVTIPIASILEGGSLVLAPPAPPLTVPGTSLIIYGAAAVLFLAPLSVAGARMRVWKQWGNTFRKRRLIRRMKKTLKSLRRDASGAAEFSAEDALTAVTRSFRSFLSAFTGMRCQAMSAVEFSAMPPFIEKIEKIENSRPDSVLSGGFLCAVFRRCDDLRFRGTGIGRTELAEVLDTVEEFMDALRASESARGALSANAAAPEEEGA
jgi:hypothetical protein